MSNSFIDNLLETSLPEAGNSGINGYTVTEAGPIGVLGQLVVSAASRKDQVHGYSLASGVVIDSTKSQLGAATYTAAATDVKIYHPANTGDQVWKLVFNGTSAAIPQGRPVAKDLAYSGTEVALGALAIRLAVAADLADTVVGVAQFVIPVGEYGYVLVKGTGWIYADATLPLGGRLAPADDNVAVAAGTAPSFGVSHVLVGSADVLSMADINCAL
tara:strand:+ start:1576 stop:2223 length:648 start_codon:yes stop_codon:yes gene_type:complete